MNALDYVRLLMTAKRNFYWDIQTPTAQKKGDIYGEVVSLINDIEQEIPIAFEPPQNIPPPPKPE